MARPSVLDDEKVARYIQATAAGAFPEQAARFAGFSASSVDRAFSCSPAVARHLATTTSAVGLSMTSRPRSRSCVGAGLRSRSFRGQRSWMLSGTTRLAVRPGSEIPRAIC
jgi:hypothetical protein